MILRTALIAAAVATACPAALAERADRDKPMLLEANRISIDEVKKQQILEGDVVISKGTLMIKAARIIISEDPYGFQKGIAFGPPGGKATFRQKRDGRDDYVEGEAERIEYDSNSEVAQLFHRAHIRAGEDEVKGDYIWYDAVSEKFLASASETRDPKAATPRVRAVIQPRNKGSAPARPEGKGESLRLRSAGEIPAQD